MVIHCSYYTREGVHTYLTTERIHICDKAFLYHFFAVQIHHQLIASYVESTIVEFAE